MAALRQWLLGVIACAMLVRLADQLCPKGTARLPVRFAGGLLLLLAMLRPVGLAEAADGAWADGYREAVSQLEIELGGAWESSFSDGIAERLAAYIEDKAEGMGAPVRAEVTMETRGGTPVPERVTLYGAYDGALSAWIAGELGVAKERQQWIDG